jgi:hypothetical protein
MMLDATQPNSVSLKEQQAEDAEGKTKELLSKIKSALQIWQHKNEGKAPEIEDLLEMLKPNDPNAIDPADPRILYFKIYYGRNSENPLYYFDPTTNGWFDTEARAWQDTVPPILSHLNERDIGTTDVFDAILHGVVDDEDYEALQKMNLIDDKSRQLWTKLNSLYTQTQAMQKSMEEQADPTLKPEAPKTGQSPVNEPSSGSNPFGEILKGAGVSSADMIQNPNSPAGENLVAKIMQASTEQKEAAVNSAPAVDMEAIRRMVRAEIAHALGMPISQPQTNEQQPVA